MKWLRTILLSLAGVAAGFALALWWVERRAPLTLSEPVAAAPPRAEVAREEPGPQSARVELLGDARGRAAGYAIPGFVVGAPDFIVADAAAVARAGRLVARTDSGQRQPIDAVWAVDDSYGLVALRPAAELSDVAVLEPAAGAGSLQIGGSVTLVSADGLTGGEIRSAAQRDELGAYYYDYTPQRSGRTEAIALTQPGSTRLLGLGVTRASRGHVAIDAEPVARLLAARGRVAVQSLAEFSEHFYSATPRGRIERLRSLLAQNRFEDVIEHAREHVNLDDVAQQEVPPLARHALGARARELLDAGRYDAALALLADAAQWLAPDEVLGTLQAEALQALGRDLEALDALTAVGAHERVRHLLLQQAGEGALDADGLALLERALQSDPELAFVHRLLGEHYAQVGDYPAAVARLNRAMELEPGLRRELEPAVARLRALRHTPVVAEVPVRRSGGTMLVETRINGSGQPFIFMVDTGASYTAISVETALRLGLRDIFFGAPVVELETANGRVFTTTARLDSVQIGTARVDDVEAVILETTGRFDGLLGQSFLRHFDIVIDRSRDVIALHRRADD